jgi:hypothetical protein
MLGEIKVFDDVISPLGKANKASVRYSISHRYNELDGRDRGYQVLTWTLRNQDSRVLEV